MNTKVKTTIIITLLVIAGAGFVLVTKPAPTSGGGQDQAANIASALTAAETSYDFGTISMARGGVNHDFAFVNASAKPVTVNQIYTSCMCTTAVLDLNGKRFGPFGMPGHGFSTPIRTEVKAGEEGKLKVIFDPAAHGPAGVGPIERVVYVRTSGGAVREFRISALVTP